MTIDGKPGLLRSGGRERVRRRAISKAQQVTLRLRVRRFKSLSTNVQVFRQAAVHTSVLAIGEGRIVANGVQLGFWPSPHALDGVIHLEARNPNSSIQIGRGAVLNNGCVLISEGPGISIGSRTLVGPSVTIFDSDFHNLDPRHRFDGTQTMGRVVIGENMFIGAGCTITKGATIGDNTVIGAHSVVVGAIPSNVIAAGNPCRVIRPLDWGDTDS